MFLLSWLVSLKYIVMDSQWDADVTEEQSFTLKPLAPSPPKQKGGGSRVKSKNLELGGEKRREENEKKKTTDEITGRQKLFQS